MKRARKISRSRRNFPARSTRPEPLPERRSSLLGVRLEDREQSRRDNRLHNNASNVRTPSRPGDPSAKTKSIS